MGGIKMKEQLELFISFIQDTYIKEEFDILNNFGLMIIKPAWIIKSIFIWILCPLLIPEFLFKQSKIYHRFNNSIKSMYKILDKDLNLFQNDISKLNNKITTNNFIHQRFGKGHNFTYKVSNKGNKK